MKQGFISAPAAAGPKYGAVQRGGNCDDLDVGRTNERRVLATNVTGYLGTFVVAEPRALLTFLFRNAGFSLSCLPIIDVATTRSLS